MIFKKKRKDKPDQADDKYISMKVTKEEAIGDGIYTGGIKGYKDLILPSGIDVLSSQYVNIDGAYVTTILCLDFPYSIRKGFLDKLVNFGEGVEICLYHQPEDSLKIIKEITYLHGFTKYKMQTGGDNQVDSGMQENASESSLYMKKQLSKGDEFYYINLYIRVTAESEQALEEKLRRVESELAGKNIFYQKPAFRQLEGFVTSLPLNISDQRMKMQTQKNILTSGLCGLYPFISSSLSDPEGMFIGYNDHDNSQVILDIFDTDKYSNANMIVCGKSGSGKTFTTQMLAGRFRMQKIPTMLICPLKGHEYKPLCDNIGGNFMKFAPGEQNNINIMEIRPTKHVGVEKASYLADKLQSLKLAFSLLIPDITSRELRLLDAPLKRVYEQKGITMDNASIYVEDPSDRVISLRPKTKKMPVLSDAQTEMAKIPELQRLAEELEPFTTGSLNFFNVQTNVDLENLYTVADVSDIPPDLMAFVMFVVLDVYWDRIKRDRTQKKVVILDELWKLIGKAGNEMVAEYVLEIFKIIRGYGGAAIGTTQDIQDFMMLEEGKYGKGIINASNIKIVHQLEVLDAEALGKVLNLSEEELSKVMNFKKGQGLLFAGYNHLAVKITAFKTEERLINTDRKKLFEYEKEGIV